MSADAGADATARPSAGTTVNPTQGLAPQPLPIYNAVYHRSAEGMVVQHLDLQTAHQLLAGQLSAAVTMQWQAHVRECARCRDLLAAEKELKSLLALGDVVPQRPEHQGEVQAPPAITAVAASDRQQRRARRMAIGQCVLIVGLAMLLTYQVWRRPSESEQLAAELHITTEQQAQVVANLGLLSTLEAEPWLVEDGETVHTLKRLITREQE